MGQFGFFDADKRLAAISAKGDPLEMIDRVVPFESFRAEIEAAVLTPAREKIAALAVVIGTSAGATAPGGATGTPTRATGHDHQAGRGFLLSAAPRSHTGRG